MSNFFQRMLSFLYSYWGVILVFSSVFGGVDLIISKIKKIPEDRSKDTKRKKIVRVVMISIALIITIWGVLATVFLTEVPDIIGYKYEDAKRVLEDYHLKIDFDSKENEWEIANYIVKTQVPASEKVVRRKEIVKVTIAQPNSDNQLEGKNRTKEDLLKKEGSSPNSNVIESVNTPLPSPSAKVLPQKESSDKQAIIQSQTPITSQPAHPAPTQRETPVPTFTPKPDVKITPTPVPTPTPILILTPIPVDLSISVSYTIIPIPITDNNLTISAYTNRQVDYVTVTAISESNSFGPFNMKTTDDHTNWYFPAAFYENGSYVVTVTAYSSDGASASDSFSVTYPF